MVTGSVAENNPE
jgi:hypothetical protein